MAQAFKEWYISGLQALISANEIGEGTTQKLMKYITSPELKTAIEQGHKAAGQHAETIKQLLQQAGSQRGELTNEVMVGIDKAAEQIPQSSDADVRDAGVITSAQIALHYYMAAYGSLAATAKHLGMNDQAQTFSRLGDEIKQADQKYTQMAEQDVNQRAQAA